MKITTIKTNVIIIMITMGDSQSLSITRVTIGKGVDKTDLSANLTLKVEQVRQSEVKILHH